MSLRIPKFQLKLDKVIANKAKEEAQAAGQAGKAAPKEK